MNDVAISEVQKYMDEYFFPPNADWPEYYFEERSYARWAANEIISRLKKQHYNGPIEVISNFVSEMREIIYSPDLDRNMEFVLTIAIQAAEDILTDLFA